MAQTVSVKIETEMKLFTTDLYLKILAKHQSALKYDKNSESLVTDPSWIFTKVNIKFH